ncbi:MAG TPA: methyltransferase domain-containing protein, partial [Planctomycetota bacterium]|nr:methyltransferase domain-containing protein [Planctomycetota bacterium]
MPPPAGRALPREEIERRVGSVETWYHCIDLGHGVVTPGVFDMRPFVGEYGIPEDLGGIEALDVGASNGFFSFLLAARGARVLASELPGFAAHDLPGWWRERRIAELGPEGLGRIDHHEVTGGFEVAREILDAPVERVFARIDELPRRVERRFDLVLCSNVLPHVRDPLGALEAVREVLRPGGRLILAAPTDRSQPSASYAVFVPDPDVFAWWVPSAAALLGMCRKAGFEEPAIRGEFEVASRTGPPRREWIT